jgi:hypothetical protein
MRRSLASLEAVTDDDGVARATLKIGPCKGGILGPIRVPTRGNPPDFWDIKYNPAALVIATIPGNDLPTGIPGDETRQWFQHVCREVFRMHRS